MEHNNPATHNTDQSSAAPQQPLSVDPKKPLGRGAILALIVVGVILLVLIVIGIISRFAHERTLEKETTAAAIDEVKVISPSGGAKAGEIVLPADTHAFIETGIYSRTNGYLTKWFADIGATVHKGELLAIIQTPEVDQQVQQAQAEVATAESNLKIAQITADRWKALLAKQAVSHQEADQALSDYTARQSNLSSSQANLRRLQQLQGFEKIYAPFDGVITARNVDVGSLIQAGDSNTPHAELFHLAAIGRLRLFVPVPEVNASAVKNGLQINVTTDAFPGQVFTGSVARNSTSIDTASRTLNMEVDLENPDHKLLPGQYAFVHLPLPAGSSSMTLSSTALLFRAEGLRVGLFQNGQVHLQPIKIGRDYGATVEVIAGLQPGDKIIDNPSDSLYEGQPVRLTGGQQ